MAKERLDLGNGFHLMVAPEDDIIGIEQWEILANWVVDAKKRWDKAKADGKITIWEKLKLSGMTMGLVNIMKKGAVLVDEANNFSEEEYHRLYSIIDDGFELKSSVDDFVKELIELLRIISNIDSKIIA